MKKGNRSLRGSKINYLNIIEVIKNCTVQIFFEGKPLGSGVLGYYSQRFFLLSAAHLFWKRQIMSLKYELVVL